MYFWCACGGEDRTVGRVGCFSSGMSVSSAAALCSTLEVAAPHVSPKHLIHTEKCLHICLVQGINTQSLLLSISPASPPHPMVVFLSALLILHP